MPASLTTLERDCVDRYVATLCDELGDKLEEVWLFGSAARKDMWADFWPMRSDIDLLVVTAEPMSHAAQDELAALTYRMYLECGRAPDLSGVPNAPRASLEVGAAAGGGEPGRSQALARGREPVATVAA